MPETHGPWGRRSRFTPEHKRTFVLVALAVAGGFGLGALVRFYPDAVATSDDRLNLLYLLGLLSLVSAGFVARRRFSTHEIATSLALWACVIAVLLILYLYRGELAGLGEKIRAFFAPSG